MHSLLALAVATFTACVIAHPPGLHGAPDPSSSHILRNGPRALEPPNRKELPDYLFPRYLRSQFVPDDKPAPIPYPRPQMPASDWLNEEINRIKGMQDGEPPVMPYKHELPPWIASDSFNRIIFGASEPYRTRSHSSSNFKYPLLSSKALMVAAAIPRRQNKIFRQVNLIPKVSESSEAQEKKIFALTPTDPGYFEPTENTTNKVTANYLEGPHEGGGHEDVEDLGPPRQTRQNPISHTKTLVAGDLDKLKVGVGSDAGDTKGKPHRISLLGSDFTTGTIYVVGIAAGVGTAIILAIIGFVFGWYSWGERPRTSHRIRSRSDFLSKRAKAAADVDYPAYGVTGPTMDTSGDRKLAHSAQMYHYQHQKQQIIAMERNNAEQCNGSVSDLESEEENEEGDYTVYECPGFATTGEMEVKNPLFNEEPTPATPGDIEVVKPQPKE